MPRRPRTVLLALMTLLAVAAPACGGGTAATAGSGATSGPTSATGGGGARTPACDLLSDADIKEITGYTVASKEDDPPDTIYQNVCRWTFVENAGTLDLGVLGQDGAGFLDRTVDIEGGTPIAGLGDRAVRTGLTGSILALAGDTLIDLFVAGAGTTDEVEERLVERALANLAR